MQASRREQEKHRAPALHWRWLWVGLCAAMLLAAVPAWAARVVDVRVGQHAGYSRVVFELDSSVGYKVERNTPSAGVNELIVSLDAAAKARTLRGKLDYIDSVEVRPVGADRSSVRIRLKGDDLKLKEMILASPPRIVLDVLNEKALAAAKAPTKKKVAKAPAAKTTAPTAKTTAPTAKTTAPTAKTTAPTAKTTARTTAPKPAPAPAEKPAERVVQSRTQLKGDRMPTPQPPASLPDDTKVTSGPGVRMAAKAPAARPTPTPDTPAKATPPAATTPPDASATPPRRAAPPTPGMPAQPPAEARPRPTPAATARPQATPPRPAAATPPGVNGLFSLQNIAVGAIGLLLVVAAGVFFVRRRNAAEVVDASAFDNPLGDDENPFAGLDAGADVEAETEEIPISQAARAEVGIPLDEDEDEGPPSSQSRSAQEGKKMDMTSDNAQTTLLDSSPMAAGMAGGGDAARMIAEFERRMAAMETRIDELVDAKERLERQVAAQTEELRVQRAAIARTQRAVRNLSRPGEDAPTEPALRDPSRPEGPRS